MSSSTGETSLFLALPPEIRLRIYEHHFGLNSGLYFGPPYEKFGVSRPVDVSPYTVQLLLSNRQVYTEAFPVLCARPVTIVMGAVTQGGTIRGMPREHLYTRGWGKFAGWGRVRDVRVWVRWCSLDLGQGHGMELMERWILQVLGLLRDSEKMWRLELCATTVDPDSRNMWDPMGELMFGEQDRGRARELMLYFKVLIANPHLKTLVVDGTEHKDTIPRAGMLNKGPRGLQRTLLMDKEIRHELWDALGDERSRNLTLPALPELPRGVVNAQKRFEEQKARARAKSIKNDTSMEHRS